MKEKIIKTLFKPSLLIEALNRRGYLKWIQDRTYVKWQYKKQFDKELNLDNPQTFNEKLQWLKLHDRKSEYIKLVDKHGVRKYVSGQIGEDYLIPLYGVWESIEDIDWDNLPKEFVIKTTHDSGGVVICKNKSELDIDDAEKKLKKSLSRNFYYSGREWPYKYVKPKIIAEKYLNHDGKGLDDYKFFCFNGVPKFMHISSNREVEVYIDYFDMDFNHINIQKEGNKNNPNKPKKPEKFDEMAELAIKLSKNFPFVRVDFYNLNKEIYFGELTFYPAAGYNKFIPSEYDLIIGNLLELPKDKS